MRVKKQLDDESLRRYKIIVATEFWAAFDEISTYISANWTESSVENFRAAVSRKIGSLDLFPGGHQLWRESEFRSCLVWDYLIFFQIDDAKNLVIVAKIYHAAQDLESLLDNNKNNKEEK